MLGGVDLPAQRAEQEAQVVVEQAVADEERRPARELVAERLGDRVEAVGGVHPQDEADVVLVGHDDGLGGVDVAVHLEDEGLGRAEVATARVVTGGQVAVGVVGGDERLLLGTALGALEERVVVRRDDQRERKLGQRPHGRRRPRAALDRGPDPLDELARARPDSRSTATRAGGSSAGRGDRRGRSRIRRRAPARARTRAAGAVRPDRRTASSPAARSARPRRERGCSGPCARDRGAPGTPPSGRPARGARSRPRSARSTRPSLLRAADDVRSHMRKTRAPSRAG